METFTTPPAHTPGPWNTYDYEDEEYPWIIIENDQGYHIAQLDRSVTQPDTSTANANLIAKAPDLLNLVQKLVVVCDDRIFDLTREAGLLADLTGDEDQELQESIDHYASLKKEAEDPISRIQD